jgi:hypothetical protein
MSSSGPVRLSEETILSPAELLPTRTLMLASASGKGFCSAE